MENEFNNQEEIGYIVKKIINSKDYICKRLDPKHNNLRIRMSCPKCGLTDKNSVKNKINTEPPPSPKPVNMPDKIPIIISNISFLPPFYSLLKKHYLYTRID